MFVSRWLVYAIVGIAFGIFDWYYLEVLANLSWPRTTIAMLIGIGINWGVWLVPALPIAAIEVTRSGRIWRSALAVIVLWFCAICSYYVYYGFLMAFDGQSPLSLIEAVRAPAPDAWQDWWRITQTLTFGDIRDWGRLAIIGGAIVGSSIGLFTKLTYRRTSHKQISTSIQ